MFLDLRHSDINLNVCIIFFSIYTYTHVQFEQLHKYIQNRNEIFKKWYI